MAYVRNIWIVMSMVISIDLYGFREDFSPRAHKISQGNFLDVVNQRIRHFHWENLQEKTHPYSSIKRLKRHLAEQRVVRKTQSYKGVSVFGSMVIEVSFGQCATCRIMTLGRKAKLSPMSVLPLISREQAMEIATKDMEKRFSKAHLVIYPTREKNYLTWLLQQNDLTQRWKVFLDAKTGVILNAYNSINHGYGENHGDEVNVRGVGVLENEQFFNAIFTGNFFEMVSLFPAVKTYQYDYPNLPGRSITSVTSNFSGEPSAAVDAQSYTQRYLEFLESRFGRVGYDGFGSPLINTIGFFEYSGVPYHNAFWNGEQVVYGNATSQKSLPFSGALDIVAHEVTHAIITKTSNLNYQDQSGALNESFCDIMATYAEHKITPEKADWKIGEDIANPYMRYMNNPARDGISRDHYRNRYVGQSDNGGVHWNSGIVNLAFYLLVEGGVHPRLGGTPIQGIGWERAIDIFYKVFTKFLAPTARFIDARDATVLVAREFDEQAVDSVMRAWAVVGVGAAPLDQDQASDQEPASSNGLIKSSPNLSIPDNEKKGVSDTLIFKENVSSFTISVDIRHSHAKDLIIQLFSPNGKRYLYHRVLGYGKKVSKNFIIRMRHPDHSAGEWTLNVRDRARKDTGALHSWSIYW